MKSRIVSLAYFALLLFEAVAGWIYLLSRPSDPENQWLGAFSLPRLVMLFLFLAFAVGGLFALRKIWLYPTWGYSLLNKIRQRSINLIAVDVATLIGLSLLLTPSYRYGIAENYFLAALPILMYFSAVLLQTELFFLIPFRFSGQNLKERLYKQKNTIKTIGIMWGGLVFLGILIGWSGVGLRGKFNWYEAGVPLLPAQIWYSLLGVLGGMLLVKKIRPQGFSSISFDIIGIVLLWLSAALLWLHTPLAPNFFAPGPYPPNYSYYPYSDAAQWDIGAQFALIGQGIANRQAIADHAGLMGLLAILHLLAGQSFERLLIFYVAIFAVFPVLLYILGKHIYNRSFAIFIAILAIFQEVNAISAGTYLNLSHVKLLMTEFPTGVGLLAVAVLLVWWLHQPAQNQAYAFPLGGVLAWLILLRYSALAIPFVVAGILFLAFGKNWKGAIRASLQLFLAVLLVLSPWMWRSWRISGNPFFFAPKASLIFRSTFRTTIPVTPTLPPAPTPSSQNLFHVEQSSLLPVDNLGVWASEQLKSNPNVAGTLWSIFNHFVHNLITSVLILPVQPFFHDLRHSIYQLSPFWDKFPKEWHGELTAWEALGLSFNLLMLSIGGVTAWKRHKIAGLVPLFLFLSYNLATAMSRTSGGRYLTPILWVVIFYYGLGVIKIGHWLFSIANRPWSLPLPSAETTTPFSYKKGILATFPFFLFVITMVTFDFVPTQRYPKLSEEQILNYAVQQGYTDFNEINISQWQAFIRNPKRQILMGLALYPRFYGMQQGELAWTLDENSPKPFPRLTFTLIGPQGEFGVSLPMIKHPKQFPNATDAIVLGCRHIPQPAEKGRRTSPYYDAVAVILLTEDAPVLYLRQPEAPLTCPLPEPVCTDRKNCH